MIRPVFHYGTTPEAKAIREQVFIVEQGFQNEYDEFEDSSWCLVLFLDETPIATGRIRALDPATYAVERIAVLPAFRGQKVGTYLLRFLETKIKTLGAYKARLNSQADKVGFYQKQGYQIQGDGEVFYEENCPHVAMEKDLSIKRRGRF
ncbi:MAG: GNAT family N-acetyltransferase [Candidatus Enteromonas sp.]|nr:GNAT family N-acetyltransferase [Candidatus Enteromonas sp.]